jgi:hypothetical protein
MDAATEQAPPADHRCHDGAEDEFPPSKAVEPIDRSSFLPVHNPHVGAAAWSGVAAAISHRKLGGGCFTDIGP